MSEVVKVIKNSNYTVMSNIHLQDQNISLKAKGLLSIVLSLPDNWDYTIAGLLHFAKDGRDSFRNTLQELEHNGYLVRERVRNESGQLKSNSYTFYEKPQTENVQIVENPQSKKSTVKSEHIEKSNVIDNVQKGAEKSNIKSAPFVYFEHSKSHISENTEQTVQKPVTEKPTLEKPTLVMPTLENPTQQNTNIQNTKYNNYLSSSSNHQNLEEELKKKISYSDLVQDHGESAEEIVNILLDAYSLDGTLVRINGKKVAADKLRSNLDKLDYDRVGYVLDCIAVTKSAIKNRRAYILTALYNADINYLQNSKYRDKSNELNKSSYDLDEFENFALNFSLSERKENTSVSTA